MPDIAEGAGVAEVVGCATGDTVGDTGVEVGSASDGPQGGLDPSARDPASTVGQCACVRELTIESEMQKVARGVQAMTSVVRSERLQE